MNPITAITKANGSGIINCSILGKAGGYFQAIVIKVMSFFLHIALFVFDIEQK